MFEGGISVPECIIVVVVAMPAAKDVSAHLATAYKDPQGPTNGHKMLQKWSPGLELGVLQTCSQNGPAKK